MCGYYGNTHECPAVIDLLNQLQIPLPYPKAQNYMMRPVDGVVAVGSEGYSMSSAIWWFDLEEKDGELVPKKDKATFNARNLHYPMWRDAINEWRAIVFASEIGETEGKNHYLMKAPVGLAIGAVYKDWESEAGSVRSMALITRPATPGFAQYHEKAQPLFLPLDADTIKTWLDPTKPADDPEIKKLLDNPTITTDLEITPVKTFKRAEVLGPSERLKADR